jgi:hypothetical protein
MWVRRSIREHRLRGCSNLLVQEIQRIEEGRDGEPKTFRYFIPICRHRSFVSNFSHLTDQQQGEQLRFSLHNNPIACPSDCLFYENRRWAETKDAVTRPFKALFGAAQSLLKDYLALPWQTQVVIIVVPAFVLICWMAPQLIPLVIELAQAVRGK